MVLKTKKDIYLVILTDKSSWICIIGVITP